MKLTQLDLKGLFLLEPKRFGDERGVFSELFRTDLLADAGFQKPFIQENLARTTARGVVRGLHFQRAPFAQDKLIRCAVGAIFDVAVDIRRDSPTFGRHHAVTLSAENWLQFLVPAGFAHGYCTLEPNTEVIYKVTAPYAPKCEGGILWSDPGLAIRWPIPIADTRANERDGAWPTFLEWAASGADQQLDPID